MHEMLINIILELIQRINVINNKIINVVLINFNKFNKCCFINK